MACRTLRIGTDDGRPGNHLSRRKQDEMNDMQATYQLFIGHLDNILLDFEDLKDNCPADFDEELAELIVQAQGLTQCAYRHALANKEN